MQKCIFALLNLSVCTRCRCIACVPYVVVVLYFHRHMGVVRSYRCHCLYLVCSGKITTCVLTINTHFSKRSDTPNSLVISALYNPKVFLVIRLAYENSIHSHYKSQTLCSQCGWRQQEDITCTKVTTSKL